MELYTKESLDKLSEKVCLLSVLLNKYEHLRDGGVVDMLGGIDTIQCPFCHKKESFNFDDKEYYCVACKRSGGVVEFLMKYCDYSFNEAVEWLADFFDVTLNRI